jgi:hypothetical protein
MTAKKLDAGTLRSLSRRFRLGAKGPKRNLEASRKLPSGDPDSAEVRMFSNGESRGYWRGWYCALQQLADELLEEARRLEKAKAPK